MAAAWKAAEADADARAAGGAVKDSLTAAASAQPPFFAAPAFAGAKPGYVFKVGGEGLGYYLDTCPGSEGSSAAGAAMCGGAADAGTAAAVDPSARKPRLPDVGRRTYAYLDVSIGGGAAGRLTLQLFDDLVPRTCANFRAFILGTRQPPAAILEAAKAGNRRIAEKLPAGVDVLTDVPPTLSYHGSPIHRVVKGFCVQGGDVLAGDGSGGVSSVGDGGAFADESFAVPHARPGMLSMANMGEPNTNGCQFFLTLAASPECDGKHVAFGRLVSGSRCFVASRLCHLFRTMARLTLWW